AVQSTSAVISHHLWRTALQGRPDVVGMEFLLNDRAAIVVGVAPPGFRGTSLNGNTDIWRRITQDAESASKLQDPGRGLFFILIGRLSRDATLEQARQELDAWTSALPAGEWGIGDAGSDSPARCLLLDRIGMDSWTAETVDRTFRLLVSVAATMLSVALLNSVGLIISGSLARRREWAILKALGAGRRRLLLQGLEECLVMALAAGVLAAALGYAGGRWLGGLQWIESSAAELTLLWSWRAFLFTALLTLATGAVCGLMPAWISSRTEPVKWLRESTGHANLREGWKGTLLVGQMAASLVLLIAALSVMQSLAYLYRIELGLDVRGVLSASIDPGLLGRDREQLQKLYRRLEQGLTNAPGLESPSLAEISPLVGTVRAVSLLSEEAWRNQVSPGYFETVGLRLLQGRSFTETEVWNPPADARQVAVLSTSVASRLWPGGNPIGKRFQHQGRSFWIEVVGLVESHRTASILKDSPLIYEPLGQAYVPRKISILAKSELPVTEARRRIADEVHRLDPSVALFEVESLSQRLNQKLARQRLLAYSVPILAVAALILTCAGVWGMMAGHVRLRRHEIGVRMALGARAADIRRTCLRRALLLNVLGLSSGLLIAWQLSGMVSGQLYGVSPMDRPVLLLAVGVLLLASLLAAYLPLLRVARLNPAQALRYD
ncbi:MAG: FtsX-like permease family protein, partial [Acidobacteriota bacterium]